MNSCAVSGWIQGAPELRVTSAGLRILNFEIAVEGERAPYVPVGYLLGREEVLKLHAGERVLIHGGLRHHRARGLFLAADTIRVLAIPNGKESRTEAARAAQ
jgi:hypothetical protein